MNGLLFSGGADLDPARYGQPPGGSDAVDPDRDELESAAWDAAADRQVPVLGICRGMQAINVFSGGSILQHIDGHAGAAWAAARRPRIHCAWSRERAWRDCLPLPSF